jgi:LacI family transcriptional regulator
MREVATLARVSLKTVSRVINGESCVSEELRSRVQAAIDHLDYRLNLHASLLRRGDDKRGAG